MIELTAPMPHHNLDESVPAGVLRTAVLGLMIVHTGLLAWGATRHSPSIDEAAHLPAGISHWALGRYELYAVNPPLVRSVAALPILFCGPQLDWSRFQAQLHARSEFDVGRDFIKLNGERALWFYTVGRWACIPLSLLGGWICFLWARELYGPTSGLLALSLWCFSPTILANAQMLTPDTGAAALGAAACYLFRQWLLRPTWSHAVLAGIVLGCAEASKFTWIILFLLWPATWLMWHARPVRGLWQKVRSAESLQLAAALGVSLYVINITYGFDGTFRPLREYTFVSTALRKNASGDNRFRGTVLAHLPVPLPRDYVLGIDLQKRDFEIGLRSYLLGVWQERGWWYYYLVALAVKVPLGAWALLVTAAVLRLTRLRNAVPWREDVLLLAPAFLILFLVSSQTGFGHHVRYVLPIFPFMMIWMGQVVHAIQGHRIRQVVVGVSWMWFVGSSLWYYPHSLSYFNELAGGPLKGHRVLVDSNIDWGQDLLYLKWWLDEHPEARPLGLAFFGQVDPGILGIEYSLPPIGPTVPGGDRQPESSAVGPAPGWYAVSVSILRGLEFSLWTGDGGRQYIGDPGFTYFQQFEPVALAGYSIYIYHLTLDDVNPVRRRLGLDPLINSTSEH